MSSKRHITLEDRIILSLDVSTLDEAKTILDQSADVINFYKIGYQLLYSGHGYELGRSLLAQDKKVFFDFKLLDIDNTVEKGVAQIAETGATFLTIHAYKKAMQAAVRGRNGSDLKLFGVTVMTHFDDQDLIEIGYSYNTQDLVKRRAEQAAEAGMDGLICSAHEVNIIRDLLGDALILTTPGIRPQSSGQGDQKRVMTPFDAIKAGADYLVIGRPILTAPNLPQMVRNIQSDVQAALEASS